MKELPVRKYPRLKKYDYSQSGSYFVTFCVKNRYELLGRVVEAKINAPQSVKLTDLGEVVQQSIEFMKNSNSGVKVPKYVIMPNHVHMIITLTTSATEKTVGHGSPTLQSLVGRIKSYTANRWNEMCSSKYLTFWQRSFHEHIIRNDSEYLTICQYIDDNPTKWNDDEYYNQPQ